MEEYHKIWCEKHRKESDWLQVALLNGFDIHHVDGDHTNNESENLVLIYSGDHLRMHGLVFYSGRKNGQWKTKEELDKMRHESGEIVYQMRLDGKMWKEINSQVKSARHCGKFFAKESGKPWPPLTRNSKKEQKKSKPRESKWPPEYKGLSSIEIWRKEQERKAREAHARITKKFRSTK